MDRLKRRWPALFVDNGLFLALVLIVIGAFTWSRFIDWSGPLDEMSAKDREALEGCVMSERTLGDRVFTERPDCRDVLTPAEAAARVR